MALIWMDGFDHYGTEATGRNNMVDLGVYAAATATSGSTSAHPSTSNPRTGTHSLRLFNGLIRRTFGVAKSQVGVGYALFLGGLQKTILLRLAETANNTTCHFQLESSGQVSLYRGGSSSLAGSLLVSTTPTQILVANAWQHVEFFVYTNNSNSSCEMRVNGVTKFTVSNFQSGRDINGTLASIPIQMSIYPDTTNLQIFVDDLYAWDTSGSFNNDFIGDRKVATLFPNQDTTQADWLKSAGSDGYAVIDENPQNGDTDYIYCEPDLNDPPEPIVSDFQFSNMPIETGPILGVQNNMLARKTDAGDCVLRADIVSDSDVTLGTDAAINQSYLYTPNIFETDPATGALWTKSGLDAAKIRLNRVV